jgi:tRNA-2-methylthio-N6-dimethylallyladenosine synthase
MFDEKNEIVGGGGTAVAEPQARPKKYAVLTWGCQMNVDDSDQIGALLQGEGMEATDDPAEADVVMLNTCSVRQKPEDKVFSKLGELAEIKRQKPDMVIGVMGCMAQRAGAEIAKRAPHIDLVAGTAQLEQIPGMIQNRRFGCKPARCGPTSRAMC